MYKYEILTKYAFFVTDCMTVCFYYNFSVTPGTRGMVLFRRAALLLYL